MNDKKRNVWAWIDDALDNEDASKRKEALAQWIELPQEDAASSASALAEFVDRFFGPHKGSRLSRLSQEGERALKKMAKSSAQKIPPFDLPPAEPKNGAQQAGWSAALLKVGAGALCVKSFKEARPQDFDLEPLSRGQLPLAALRAAQWRAHPAALARIGQQCGFELPCARNPLPPAHEPAGLFWRLVARESALARNFSALARFSRFLDLREPLLGGPGAFSLWVAANASKMRLRFNLGARDDLDWACDRDGRFGQEQKVFWERFERLQALCGGLPPDGSPGAHPEQRRALWIAARQARGLPETSAKQAEREKSLGLAPAPDSLELSYWIWGGGAENQADAALWSENFFRAQNDANANLDVRARALSANEWPPRPWDEAEAGLWARSGVDWRRLALGPAAQMALGRAASAPPAEAKKLARTAKNLLGLPLPASVLDWGRQFQTEELAGRFNACFLNTAILLAAREQFEHWSESERISSIALSFCARVAHQKDNAGGSVGQADQKIKVVESADDAKALAQQATGRGPAMRLRGELGDHGLSQNWRADGVFRSAVYAIAEAPGYEDAFARAWSQWENAQIAQASAGVSRPARGRAPRAL